MGRWGTREIQWWTFAGGRVNSTLRYALAAAEPGWSIIPDNYAITLRGDTLTMGRFLAAREQLARPDFWDDIQFWQGVAAALPNYRLSKFQPLMPPGSSKKSSPPTSATSPALAAGWLMEMPASQY